MLAGLAIGRLGDIINGEHYAKASDLPWAVTYSHPDSPGFFRDPQHPAVIYEMMGDLVILGILAFAWRMKLKPGVIFCLGFILYAIMRFFVSFLRLDSKEPLLGLSTPQLVSLLVIAVTDTADGLLHAPSRAGGAPRAECCREVAPGHVTRRTTQAPAHGAVTDSNASASPPPYFGYARSMRALRRCGA